ncbi:hypothetical protein WJX72_011975 [[Myrmecia] bisecta]|uniref:LMBR1-like membrane protein n=1 Tax=[Myrmecia] bisecta TaxID=41462 RepID=A0AAW1PE63_9CHLO
MWGFYMPSTVCVCGAVLYQLGRYAAPNTPAAVKLITATAWVTSISIVVLVPIDVWTTLNNKPQGAIGVLWDCCYWASQILTWICIPLFQGYCDSGDFTAWGRMKSSIKDNLMFYAVIGALGAVGLLAVLLSGKMALSSIPPLAVMLSNTFGLVAVTFLLGYGLVEIPRHMWRNSEPEFRLRYYCHKLGRHAAKLAAASAEVVAVVTVVEATSQPMPKRDPLRPYMDIIYATAEAESPIKPSQCPKDDRGRVNLDDLTDQDLDYGCDEKGLAQLRVRMERANTRYAGLKAEYANAVLHAFDLETICKCRTSGESVPRGASSSLQHARLMYKCWLRPWVLKLAALALTAVSAAIVWSEATIGSGREPDLSPFSRVIHRADAGEVECQLLVMLPLAFMCAASHFSLFKLGMFNFYHLVPHATGSHSLLLNSALVCRFAPPLCFNFLHVIRMHEVLTGGKGTVFSRKMGAAMKEVPLLGQDFNTWFPLVVVIFCTLMFLNVWDMAARFCVPARYRFDEDSAADEYTERGKVLVRQEQDAAARGQAIGEVLGLWGTVETPSAGSHGAVKRSTSRARLGLDMENQTATSSTSGARRHSRGSLSMTASTSAGHALPTGLASTHLSPLTRELLRNKYGSTESVPSLGSTHGSAPLPGPASGLDAIFARMSPASSTNMDTPGRIDDDDGTLLAGSTDSLYNNFWKRKS